MIYSIDQMPERISIGRETETGITDVMIDCGAWAKKWPGMEMHAIHMPYGGEPYILQTETDGNVLVWHVTDADTATPGTGRMEIVGEMDGRRKVSAIVKVSVAARMAGVVGEPPEAVLPWVDRVIGAADRITGMQVQAETLDAGSGATAAWDGEHGLLTIGVPKGEQGPKGEKGEKGQQGEKGEPGKDAVVDATLTQSGQAADAKVTGDVVSQLKDDLSNETANRNSAISKTVNEEKERAIARENEIEALFTAPTEEAVNRWLDQHPEATTTVQDHSLQIDKFVIGTLGYVTPEMFGAVGDGVSDDTQAIKDAIASDFPINLHEKTYRVEGSIDLETNVYMFDGNIYSDSYDALTSILVIGIGCKKLRLENIRFSSVMDKPSATFNDTVMSSKIIFISEVYDTQTSDCVVVLDNCIISDCEYCVKANYAKYIINNCDFINSMMTFYGNSITCFVSNSIFETVATNRLYHALYLHPSHKTSGFYFDNCIFRGEMNTVAQVYNENALEKNIDNIYFNNCKFLDFNDALRIGCTYEDCYGTFIGCHVRLAYRGYFKNCVALFNDSTPYYDISVENSKVTIDTITLQNGDNVTFSNCQISVCNSGNYPLINSGNFIVTHSSIICNATVTSHIIRHYTGAHNKLLFNHIVREEGKGYLFYGNGEFVALNNVIEANCVDELPNNIII